MFSPLKFIHSFSVYFSLMNRKFAFKYKINHNLVSWGRLPYQIFYTNSRVRVVHLMHLNQVMELIYGRYIHAFPEMHEYEKQLKSGFKLASLITIMSTFPF